MKTVKSQVLYVTVFLVLISFVFWLGALIGAYLADDWSSPSADERSIPAARTY